MLVAPLAAALAALLLLLPLLPIRDAALDPLTTHASDFPRLEWLDLQLGSLALYLAVLAAWLGWLLLAARRTVGTPPPVVAWYLLVGTLAQLALYPRADTVHALLAGAPLLPIGAWALARVHHRLAAGIPRAGQVAVFAALLLVPGAAILPHAYAQYLRLAHPNVRVTATTYEQLQLSRAPVLVDTALVEDLRDTIAYIQQGTTAGEPFSSRIILWGALRPAVSRSLSRPHWAASTTLMPRSSPSSRSIRTTRCTWSPVSSRTAGMTAGPTA